MQLFVAMGTQWRVAMGGPTGLDYAALPIVARAMNIKLKASVLDGIRAMECEAIRVMGEARDQASRKS